MGRLLWSVFQSVMAFLVLELMLVVFLLAVAGFDPVDRRLDSLDAFRPHPPSSQGVVPREPACAPGGYTNSGLALPPAATPGRSTRFGPVVVGGVVLDGGL